MPPRLIRVPLPGAATLPAVARQAREDRRLVVLSGRWAGGGAIVTSEPARAARPDEDPFALLGAASREASPPVPDPGAAVNGGSATTCVGESPFTGGGWFGWLGFGLARRIERLPPPPPRPAPLPDFDLAFHDHLVRRGADGRWWFEALWTPERADALAARREVWRARIAGRAAPAPAPAPPHPHPAVALEPVGAGLAGHRAAAADARARIAAGEVFQVNVCLRLEGELDGDLLELWLAGVNAADPGYAAYIGGQDHAVASLSPELFLRRRGREVVSRPVKGTAPRSTDPGALVHSAKDRAENVMIVDLMRNDLGRVCRYGSVSAPEICVAEPAAGVWHLVSTVRGELRAGVDDGELLRATFPPGSVTGAPKVQAIKVIHALEATGREAYCGAIGLSSPLAGLELGVAIRTFERRGERMWLGAGGAVVHDSSPEAETAEALIKARGVAAAAGVQVAARAPAGSRRPAAGHPLPPAGAPRPDPACGVLETLLVRDGLPVELDSHLARLRAGCRAAPVAWDPDLPGRVLAVAAELANGALRVTVDVEGARVVPRALPAGGPTRLRPVALPGGLGAHKWADRRLIDRLSSPGVAPLLCELDGTVLEAGYAAVMLIEAGRLIAPPLDGRLLPSLSRERVLAAAVADGIEVVLEPFTLERARAAQGMLLSSSLRGPHPGVLADGPRPDSAHAWSRRLADFRACAQPPSRAKMTP